MRNNTKQPTRPSRLPQILSGALATAMIILGFATPAHAAPNTEVVFADSDLKACVADNLGVSDADPVTEGQLASLDSLNCQGRGIVDISPLQYAQNLTYLILDDNAIVDVSPLAGLTGLTYLSLGFNEIADVSPLAGLTGLTHLYLFDNAISDVSPLAGLTGLTILWLDVNKIADVSPLAGLTGLSYLELGVNEIADVSPLAALTRLIGLHLSGNKIVDVSSLAGLTGLSYLGLSGQVLASVDAVAGVASSTPVLDAAGATVPMTVDSGTGTVSNGEVLWTASGTGQLSWNTTGTIGTANFTFSGIAPYDISDPVAVAPTLTGTPTNGVVGASYSHTFTVTGSPAPSVTVTAGTLPAGLTLSAAGVLSGAPTTAGIYTFTVTATNGTGPNATLPVTFTVADASAPGVAPGVAPTVTGAPAAGVVGTSYSHTFTVTGSPAPSVSVTAGTLPAGLTLSAAGVLSGTPTTAGTFTFTVTATNGTAPNATLDVTFTVTDPSVAVITSPAVIITPPTAKVPADGILARTGSDGDGLLSIGIGAATILLLGAVLALNARRRTRNTNT